MKAVCCVYLFDLVSSGYSANGSRVYQKNRKRRVWL